MKHIDKLFADMIIGTVEWFQALYRYVTRQPKPEPSLLALNVDWFTNCNWRDQLIAFKQIDIYCSYKH